MASPSEQLIQSSIDYSSREFTSIFQDFKKALTEFTIEMTDMTETNPAIVMGELFSAIADQLHFSMDRFADETVLGPAILRSSIINILKLIDYELSSAQPAVVDLTFAIDVILGTDLTIPASTLCQTLGATPVFFETNAALVIPAGQLNGTVAATEGRTQSEDPVAITDGKQFQSYTLTGNPIIDGTIDVFIDEGIGNIKWDIVENFSVSGIGDNHYTAERADDDTITINFGDGGQGRIPPNNAILSSQFRVGGGIIGRVGNGTIVSVVSTVLYLGSPINVSVVNNEEAQGGSNRETAEEAKVNGPNSFRTLNRAVTIQDYTDLAQQIGGVGRAQSISSGINIVTTYIVTDSGGAPTQALLDLVQSTVGSDDIKPPAVDYRTDAPRFIDIKIIGTVFVLSNFTNEAVETIVNESLANFFDIANLDFGKTNSSTGNINLADIYALIDNIQGVDHPDLDDMTLVPEAIPITNSGNGVFEDFIISESTIDEEWEIRISGLDNSGFAVLFTATGSTSGLQINTGIMNVPYVSDSSSPKIAFIFKTGTQLQRIGDIFRFRVSPKRGNVKINNSEIARHQVNSDGTFVFSSLTFTGGA